MRENDVIMVAKGLSAACTPFYLPLVGLLALFVFSYLSLLPWWAKIYIFLLVLTFTILMPTALIRTYRRYQGWTAEETDTKERRLIPYVISIVSYLLCYYVLSANHVPYIIGSIVMASLLIQVTCAIINQWWKISAHTAAIGGVAGAIMGFAEIFMFNPVWWLCLVFLLAGMVGTSRMILRQHTLEQVGAGFLVGLVCAFVAVIFV